MRQTMSIVVIVRMTSLIPQVPSRLEAGHHVVLCTCEVFRQTTKTVSTGSYSESLRLRHAAATAADASGITAGVDIS
jgi:hypothetical protein